MKHEYYDLYGKSICIPLPESYHDCMTLIKSDRYRCSGKIESSFSIIINGLRPFRSSVLFWLRLCQYRGGIFAVI